MVKYLLKFLYVFSGSKSSLVVMLALFIFTSVIEAVGIGLIGPFISIASDPNFIHKKTLLSELYKQSGIESSNWFIFAVGIAIIGIFCFKSVSYFIAQAYIYKLVFNQEGLLIARLLNGYLRVPYSFHLARNTSGLIKNVIIELNKFVHSCIMSILQVVSNSVVILFLVLLLAYTSLPFLLIILGILLPIFIIFNFFGSRFRKWGKTASEAYEEMMQTINHGLGGIKETRIIGCESYFLQQIDQQVVKHKRAVTLFFSSQILPRIIIETALIIFLILYISLSQLFFKQNIQDLTKLLSIFAVASIRLIPVTSQFIQGLATLRNSSYTLDIIYFDLKETEEQLSTQQRTEIGKGLKKRKSSDSKYQENQEIVFVKTIELKNINYRYSNTSKAALNNISLSINKGNSVALIGKSGAGKTTLVDVILGLLELESGDILVDGASIYSDIRSWQNLIGYIPQSIFLIDDTVERNIAFGVPDHLIDLEKLDKAIQSAQLTELIDHLPDGIKTSVGERGVRLSGGQRQRVGIARALYHDREILVLDEATAALDNETESLVTDAIRSLSGNKTMIIIAHRLTTVKHCDQIHMLEKGCIVKSGSYQEVVGEG